MTLRQPRSGERAGFLPHASRHAPACRCAVSLFVAAFAAAALANPHGVTVISGTATTATSGSQLTVTASQNAFLNWQSFNINAGETTTFQQPSAGSVVWNQIGGASPSQIFGNLNANGTVVLINSSGFYFGPNSVVKAAGLIATTATPEPNFTSGGSWEFNGAPPAASIVNYGRISVGTGGSLFLTAAQIDNHGILSAPGGTIGLFADQQVLISDRPDGRGLNVTAKLPTGSVNNDGQIIADAGSILASAQTVNQNGLLQANSVRENNGVIELVADDAMNLGANSVIEANGAETAVSSGGQITIKGGNTFSDTAGSVISATGGAQGGNGGTIEVSAPNISSLNSTLTAAAQPGYTAGYLSLDPNNIVLGTTGTGSAVGGTVLAGSNPGTTLNLNVNTAFVGFSQILLQAVNNITLATGTSWSLSDSTHQTSGNLTLEAGNSIIFQNGSSIHDANNWSVTLQAGVNNFTTGAIQPGVGSIYLNGGNGLLNGGSIQTTGGSITLDAGKDIQTGSGSLFDINFNIFSLASASGTVSLSAGNNIQIGSGNVETTAGGNINLTAANEIDIASTITAYGGGNINAAATVGNLNLNSGYFQTDSGSVSLTAGQSVALNGSIQTDSGAITLTAGHDIQTGPGFLTDINGYTFSLESGSGDITLSAGNNIQMGSGSIETIAGGTTGGLISLTAAQDINMGTGSVTATGGIMGSTPITTISATATAGSLNIGSEFIQTDTGSISLTANQNILVGTGAVTTIGGGAITATAVKGSVNTGTDANGYLFFGPAPNGSQPGGLQVDLYSLGGISTGAGGNVTITAGQNVTSFLPTGNHPAGDAGAGAFGPERGDVTITAGGNVIGHYVVANGNGTITAGGSAGTTTQQLALSLINGNWSVSAAQNIELQEVRDPNGIFNNRGSPSTPSYHAFDYGLNDSVSLTAGNSVELTGGNLPRNAGESIPSIYPPSLTINAGAGGIKLDNELILFPSPQGSLNITTTGGGSMVGNSALNPTELIMSDSLYNPPNGRLPQYINGNSFGIGNHDPTPVHLNSETAFNLNISGDLDNIYLVAPEPAHITVGGNMNNCAFQGQNLHPTDVTSINVAGNIFNLNNYSSTTLTLASAPDFTPLNFSYGAPLSELFGRLFYNPATGVLTLQGQMSPQEAAALFNVQVQVLNSSGQPEFDPQGNPILQTVHILDPNNSALVAAVHTLQVESLGVPNTPGAGYVLGGPGAFSINAHNIDLGATLGIQSVGPLDNPALAPYCYNPSSPSVFGASVNVTLSGNLDMFSTTICSLAGGDVNVIANSGSINVGTSSFTPNDTFPRGIFSAGQGNVTVLAGGDININGSRIAAYDGGNVTVESLTGNVNAGSGGNGACTVEQGVVVPVIDPQTGKIISFNVETYAPTIPGSGILATTFPQPIGVQFPVSCNPVGNIDVATPQGNIIANAGGIVQLPLNGVTSSTATVTLTAGTKNPDGTVLYPGSIDASGSGVIGANVNLTASAGITGVIVAQENLNVAAGQNVNVTAVAVGNVNVSAGGTVSGTIVGVGGISASGSSIDASLLSQNVNASGNVSGQVGFAQANVAGTTSQASSSDDQSKTAVATTENTALNDDQKNKKRPGLIKTGRVTVVLPDKT